MSFINSKDVHYPQGQLIKSSLFISLAMSVGAILEIARDTAIVFILGANILVDAFFLAIVIPMMFAGAFQALGQMVILPWFGDALNEGDDVLIARLNSLFTISLIPSTLLILFSVITSPIAVKILAGSAIDSDTLLNILHLVLPVIGLSVEISILTAYLNACGMYTYVALRKAINSFAFLSALFIFSQNISASALGYSFIAGYISELLFLIIPCISRLRTTNLAEIKEQMQGILFLLKISIIPLIGYFSARINLIIERVLAGYLIVGSVTAVTIGRRYTLALANITIEGINTVTLSEMSRRKPSSRSDNIGTIVNNGIRLVFLVIMPLSAFLIAFNKPLLELLFTSRNYDLRTLDQTSIIMLFFAIGLPFYSITPQLLNRFYSVGLTKIPSVQKIFTVLINISINVLLIGRIGICAIGLGFLVSITCSTLLAIHSVKKEFGLFISFSLLWFIIKILIGSIVALTSANVLHYFVSEVFLGENVIALVCSLFLSIAIGLFVLLLSMYLLRVEEISLVLNWVQSSMKTRVRN